MDIPVDGFPPNMAFLCLINGGLRPSHVSKSWEPILQAFPPQADAPSVCKSPTDRRREATDCQGPGHGGGLRFGWITSTRYLFGGPVGFVRINGYSRINGLFHLLQYIYCIYNMLINGIYIEVITHRLTIDPNFLRHPGR